MVSTDVDVKIDIHSLLRQLVDYEASDLHLKAGSPPVFVYTVNSSRKLILHL